jgi:hypothetical protein
MKASPKAKAKRRDTGLPIRIDLGAVSRRAVCRSCRSAEGVKAQRRDGAFGEAS